MRRDELGHESTSGNASLEDDFWNREYKTSNEIWVDLHRLQTDFCFAQELSAYFTCPGWLGAERVLDVGCGSGYFLRRLASVFPEKDYTGTDSNNYFIDVAQEQQMESNVQFHQKDLFELSGQYDFVVIRLVMQHLDNPQEALNAIAGLLRHNGTAFIIDAKDEARFYWPEPTEYIHFFDSFAAHQKDHGRDRNIAAKIQELVHDHPSLSYQSSHDFLIPSTIPGNQALFEETYYLVIRLLELGGEMHYDFDTVREAWQRWCRLQTKYMQVGLCYITLIRSN